MPESLIDLHCDEIAFSVLAIAVIFFASAAILSNNTRTAIVSFLAASITISGLIALLSNTVIAIVVAVIYVPVCSLFLLTPSNDGHQHARLLSTKTPLIAAASAVIVVSLVCMQFRTVTLADKGVAHYSGIAGITLLMTLVFTLVIAGIVALWSIRQNGRKN
jgi:NADH:ubiquinone oxidoreductase subunit 6 (subunit J)